MGLREAADTVATSLVQAPIQSGTAVGSMLAGTITGSLVIQILAGLASVLVIVNTIYNIHLTRLRIKNEKKDQL